MLRNIRNIKIWSGQAVRINDLNKPFITKIPLLALLKKRIVLTILINMERNEAQNYHQGTVSDRLCKTIFRESTGGHLGIFLGGYVLLGTLNWHPVIKKISPKIDTTFQKWANFLYPVLGFALKPKTDTPFQEWANFFYSVLESLFFF